MRPCGGTGLKRKRYVRRGTAPGGDTVSRDEERKYGEGRWKDQQLGGTVSRDEERKCGEGRRKDQQLEGHCIQG